MKKLSVAGLLITLSLVSGCKSIPVLNGSKSKDCAADYHSSATKFYAIGSASDLEQAKLNARKDLAQQISSEITSRIERQVKDRNGKISRSASDYVKSESSAIPIDQHQIEDVCESGGQFYVRASLTREALIHATRQRLDKNIAAMDKQLQHAARASLYEKYRARNALVNEANQSQAYLAILRQYAGQQPSAYQNMLLARAETFIEQHKHLRLGVTADASVNPLLSLLEQSLSKAQLSYQKGSRNVAAVLDLKGNLNQQINHGRYVVQLHARVRVKRSDSGELLSEKDLGQVTTVSTAGYDVALKNAQRQLQLRLKRYLEGSGQEIKLRLGLGDL